MATDRELILTGTLPAGRLWLFDELHKFRGWRNYLEGLWDGRPAVVNVSNREQNRSSFERPTVAAAASLPMCCLPDSITQRDAHP